MPLKYSCTTEGAIEQHDLDLRLLRSKAKYDLSRYITKNDKIVIPDAEKESIDVSYRR